MYMERDRLRNQSEVMRMEGDRLRNRREVMHGKWDRLCIQREVMRMERDRLRIQRELMRTQSRRIGSFSAWSRAPCGVVMNIANGRGCWESVVPTASLVEKSKNIYPPILRERTREAQPGWRGTPSVHAA